MGPTTAERGRLLGRRARLAGFRFPPGGRAVSSPHRPVDASSNHLLLSWRRALVIAGALGALTLLYLLRGVLLPLFFAFLLAYALDPFVDRLEAMKVPRALGALSVMAGIFAIIVLTLVFAIPLFLDELRLAAQDLPSQLLGLEQRLEPWMWQTFKVKVPHSLGELGHTLGDKLQSQAPRDAERWRSRCSARSLRGRRPERAIVPVFALYPLIDFDRIVARAG